jgi:hypothetical protein
MSTVTGGTLGLSQARSESDSLYRDRQQCQAREHRDCAARCGADDRATCSSMIKTEDEFSKQEDPRLESRTGDRLKRRLARIGRSMFGLRLEIGLGVTAVAAPFVRPTIAKRPSELCLKAAGLCLVLTGLGVRAWAAGFAGRHTRSSKIEGSKLATAGPYAHVRNPIYLEASSWDLAWYCSSVTGVCGRPAPSPCWRSASD